MEYLVILGLAGWVWLQRQRINALSRRIGALEIRVRALAAEREPLLLETPITEAADEPLLLDTPLPEPSNDTMPTAPAAETNLPGPWLAAVVLGGLYAGYGYALSRGEAALALALLSAASIAGVALGAIPASLIAPTWRRARALAPSIALSVSSALIMWVWPLTAAAPAVEIAGPALTGVLHVSLAGYATRKRWAHMSAFAAVSLTLVLGVSGYIRARASVAPADEHVYAWALFLAFALAAAALATRPSHRDRGLAGLAGGLGAAALIALAALTRENWPTLWAWAPMAAGAAALAIIAFRAAGDAAAPHADWAVTWWAGGASALALLATHALAFPAFIPAAVAALALVFAFGFARTNWRVLALAACAAAAIALAHAMSGDFARSSWGPTPPWSAIAVLGAAAALLYAAARASQGASLTSETLRAAAWLALLGAAFIALDGVDQFDSFTKAAVRALALLAAGQIVAARRDTDPDFVGRWLGPGFIAAGIAVALVRCGWTLNPWWGETPARIGGPPILNALALAFAAPALFALIAGGRWLERAPRFARLCLGAAVGLSLIWIVLETRRAFHGATMAAAPVSLLEAACYALIALGVGLGLRTRDDRERFSWLAYSGYERIAGGAAPLPLAQTPPQTPGARRERRRVRR